MRFAGGRAPEEHGYARGASVESAARGRKTRPTTPERPARRAPVLACQAGAGWSAPESDRLIRGDGGGPGAGARRVRAVPRLREDDSSGDAVRAALRRPPPRRRRLAAPLAPAPSGGTRAQARSSGSGLQRGPRQ